MVDVTQTQQKIIVVKDNASVSKILSTKEGPKGIRGESSLAPAINEGEIVTKIGGTVDGETRSTLANDTGFSNLFLPKTVLSVDGQILTRAAGAPTAITRANLALDSAFTNKFIDRSTMTVDNQMLTRTSGNVAAITRDTLAQDSAFSSRYETLNNYYHGLLSRNASLSIATSTHTPIPWNVEVFDSDNLHDNTVNPSRFTIPSVTYAGIWLFSYTITFESNTTGSRESRIRKNGSELTYFGYTTTKTKTFFGNQTLYGCQLMSMASGDYIEVVVWQNTGGNLTVYGDNTLARCTHLSAVRISP